VRQVQIMRSLKHPHIVQLLDTFEDPKRYYLVLELCRGGELFDRIVAKVW
jgi:serine/threonine protein kinase